MNIKNFLQKKLIKIMASLSLSGILAFSGLIGNYTYVHAADATQSSTINSAVIHPTSVVLSKTSDSIKLGGKDTITATIAPINVTNKNIYWVTSNKKIATVSNGIITAVRPGKVKIIAVAEDGYHEAAVCSVTIQ